MSGFEIATYLSGMLMVLLGICLAIHAHISTKFADRRDPERVKRILKQLNAEADLDDANKTPPLDS
jgi:hypothetical protein